MKPAIEPRPLLRLQRAAPMKRRDLQQQVRVLAASSTALAPPTALAPSENPNRLVPLLLLALALAVPVTALALAVTPLRLLPERYELLVEERRDTLITLGLIGVLGAGVGIVVALGL